MSYRDYVIKNGEFIGKFEDMYKSSNEIPWKQDKTAFEIFSNIDIEIIKIFNKKYLFNIILEIGCGYGYFLNRISDEVSDNIKLFGIDISESAINKAIKQFPNIKFSSFDIIKDNPNIINISPDLTIIKEVMWYVIHDLEMFIKNIKIIGKDHFLFSQSFPEVEDYYGKDIFPNPEAFIIFIKKYFNILYYVIEYDIRFNNRPLIHILCSKR